MLEGAGRLLSPYAERIALRRMAIDLLDTYVGRHAGERIFNGQIRRGALDEIEAAILMSDLRGFTLHVAGAGAAGRHRDAERLVRQQSPSRSRRMAARC